MRFKRAEDLVGDVEINLSDKGKMGILWGGHIAVLLFSGVLLERFCCL